MSRWFCFGKKDFCDGTEDCLSCEFANWEGSVNEDEISLVLSKIFGEDYNIDRLKELVEADRNHLLKEQKTQTNADKIRSMTDEELADFLEECEGKGYQDSSITPITEDGYHMDILDWLKQPAKEE